MIPLILVILSKTQPATAASTSSRDRSSGRSKGWVFAPHSVPFSQATQVPIPARKGSVDVARLWAMTRQARRLARLWQSEQPRLRPKAEQTANLVPPLPLLRNIRPISTPSPTGQRFSARFTASSITSKNSGNSRRAIAKSRRDIRADFGLKEFPSHNP